MHSRILLILWGVVLAITSTATAEEPSEEPSGHLFVLSGQSNMTGAVKSGFARVVTKELGEENVTIVHCMRSGRGIRFWVADYELPGDHPLHGKLTGGNGEEFPRLVKAVKETCDPTRFQTVHLIWMQGESDAGRDLAAAYEGSFLVLKERLGKELGIPPMHFVIGRISDYGLHGDKKAGWERMRAVQQKLAEDDPMGAWIDTDDFIAKEVKEQQGDLHYPQDQAEKLGERFGHAALKQLADGKNK